MKKLITVLLCSMVYMAIPETAALAQWTTKHVGPGTTDVGPCITIATRAFGDALTLLFTKGISDRRVYMNTTLSGNATSWSGYSEVPGGMRTYRSIAVGSGNSGVLIPEILTT